jgi:hypothetical protein
MVSETGPVRALMEVMESDLALSENEKAILLDVDFRHPHALRNWDRNNGADDTHTNATGDDGDGDGDNPLGQSMSGDADVGPAQQVLFCVCRPLCAPLLMHSRRLVYPRTPRRS